MTWKIFLVLSKSGQQSRNQIVTPENFGTPLKVEEKIQEKKSLGVLFGRYILRLRTQIFLITGAMKMSVTRFFIADAATALLASAAAFFWGAIVFLEN